MRPRATPPEELVLSLDCRSPLDAQVPTSRCAASLTLTDFTISDPADASGTLTLNSYDPFLSVREFEPRSQTTWDDVLVASLHSPDARFVCSAEPRSIGADSVRFITIDGGGSHFCALSASGDVYCWGTNYWGQLGVGRAVAGPGSSVPRRVTRE